MEENSAKEGNASAGAIDPRLKDQKILSLENTVISLNTRIAGLEGKLRAAADHPVLTDSVRQTNDHSRNFNAGSAVHSTVAANDPGAGFVNDAKVRGFQQGRILFDQEKYPEAILAFSAFLEQNETHPLAGSAQYFIAESYFLQNDYSVADQEYRKLSLRYPKSSRMSFALVRLAQCSEKLGKMDDARKYRNQAEGLFPKSPALWVKAPITTPSASLQTATSLAPIATVPMSDGMALPEVERPRVETPRVEVPHVEAPQVEVPHVEIPKVDTPVVVAPHVEMATDLDGPPSGAGG